MRTTGLAPLQPRRTVCRAMFMPCVSLPSGAFGLRLFLYPPCSKLCFSSVRLRSCRSDVQILCFAAPAARPCFFVASGLCCSGKALHKAVGRTARLFYKAMLYIFFLYQHDIRNICFLSMRFCCLLAAVIDKHLCAMLASIKRSPLARIVAGKSTRRME